MLEGIFETGTHGKKKKGEGAKQEREKKITCCIRVKDTEALRDGLSLFFAITYLLISSIEAP